MTQEIEKKLNLWAGSHPESFHHLDYERFYSMVIQSYKENFRLGGESIKESLNRAGKLNSKNSEDLVEHYSSLYHHLYELLVFSKHPK
jgi:hypothetical protein